jgi:hypothetical protein
LLFFIRLSENSKVTLSIPDSIRAFQYSELLLN